MNNIYDPMEVYASYMKEDYASWVKEANKRAKEWTEILESMKIVLKDYQEQSKMLGWSPMDDDSDFQRLLKVFEIKL